MSGVNARGWLVQVHNPTTNGTSRMAVSVAEPISAQAAAEIAKARFRKDRDLPASHTLFTLGITPAKVGTTIDSPKCKTTFDAFGFTVGCTNTARKDGRCGKCFHAAKHTEVTA